MQCRIYTNRPVVVTCISNPGDATSPRSNEPLSYRFNLRKLSHAKKEKFRTVKTNVEQSTCRCGTRAIQIHRWNRKQGSDHRTEKTGRLFSAPLYRIVPLEYMFGRCIPVLSILDSRRPPRRVRYTISGEIVERIGINLYRISDSLRSTDTPTFGN